jgi:hypothetical protein
MFTLFAIPKPFEDHIGVIQRNALASWARLHPAAEVLVFGDEAGTADAVRACGGALRHLPAVARNESGTPLVDDLFAQAERHARHRLLVYANADMILFDDLAAALARVAHLDRFLLCGRRWNLPVDRPLVFDADWAPRLRAAVACDGELAIPGAIDYFAFPRRMLGPLPPFAIGRVEWDQWLLFHTRALGAPLIDATPSVVAVHQNHGHDHLARVRHTAQREAERNRALALFHRLDLRDATHLLTPRGLQPTRDLVHLRRRLCSLPKFYLPAWRGVRLLYGLWRRHIRGLGPPELSG